MLATHLDKVLQNSREATVYLASVVPRCAIPTRQDSFDSICYTLFLGFAAAMVAATETLLLCSVTLWMLAVTASSSLVHYLHLLAYAAFLRRSLTFTLDDRGIFHPLRGFMLGSHRSGELVDLMLSASDAGGMHSRVLTHPRIS